MITPTTNDLLTALRSNPHSEMISVWTVDYKSWLILTTPNMVIYCDGNKWWWYHCDGYTNQPQYKPEPTQFSSLDPNDIHIEIDRVLNIAKQTHNPSSTMQETVSTEQTFVSIDRYRELEAQLKTVTEERDKYKASYDYAQNGLHEVWDVTGWLEKADNEPCGIEYLKRLKSKADRAGLLSVVCRRLCGDENATPETVHKALNRVDDESKALDFIGEKVGSVPFHLGEVQTLVAQLVKSLSEKTVEVAKLQEGLTNYKAHVEGLTTNIKLLVRGRDAGRAEYKQLAETIEDLKRTTVKLPNEHTLRRLFNRHNTSEKYRDGTPIPTMERLLMLIESLESQVSVQTRRAEHMALVNCNHEAMISDTHAILDEHGVQSYAGDTYLGLPARLRQLFATHTKV